MIPIECSRLPRLVKQALLDREQFLFPPQDMSILIEICREHDIPIEEAEQFCLDNVVAEPVDYEPIIIAGISFHWTDGLIDLCGPPMSGKTFICQTLVSRVLSSAGVVYIDTDGSICKDDIARSMSVSSADLERLNVYRAKDWKQLLAFAHIIEDTVIESEARLVIVDSIASPLRHALGEELAKKNRVMNCICEILREINERFKCIVIVINQTTTKIYDDEKSQLIPCLGKGYQAALTRGKLRRITAPIM